MDVRINEVQSRVQVGEAPMLDPRVIRDLIAACIRAVKEDQEREKRTESESKLSTGNEP
jgi:hypothetical protein